MQHRFRGRQGGRVQLDASPTLEPDDRQPLLGRRLTIPGAGASRRRWLQDAVHARRRCGGYCSTKSCSAVVDQDVGAETTSQLPGLALLTTSPTAFASWIAAVRRYRSIRRRQQWQEMRDLKGRWTRAGGGHPGAFATCGRNHALRKGRQPARGTPPSAYAPPPSRATPVTTTPASDAGADAEIRRALGRAGRTRTAADDRALALEHIRAIGRRRRVDQDLALRGHGIGTSLYRASRVPGLGIVITCMGLTTHGHLARL